MNNQDYKTWFKLWADCVESVDFDEGVRCQKTAVDFISSKESKAKIINATSVNDIKRLEASLLTYRNYVNLHILSLKALVNTYEVGIQKYPKNQNYKLNFEKYAGKLKVEVPKIIKYLKDSYNVIELIKTY